MSTTPDVNHPDLYGGWVADAIDADRQVDYTAAPVHVLAEQVAPSAWLGEDSTGARFLSTVRDAALDTWEDYDELDRFRRDVLDGTLIASLDVWQAWTDLRLWQDQQAAIVLAAADLNMVAHGSLDVTDVARVALHMVGGRLVDLLWRQLHPDDD